MVQNQSILQSSSYARQGRKLSVPSISFLQVQAPVSANPSGSSSGSPPKPNVSQPQRQSLGGAATNVGRRRFSHVGVGLGAAMSRRLSVVNRGPPQDVIWAGRALAGLYIRFRLRRAGVFSKRPGLGAGASAVSSLVKEVFPYLACAAGELERAHPRVFSNVSRQTGVVGEEVDEAALLMGVAHQILALETWGAVVAVFCVAGSLAVESALNKETNSDRVSDILDGVTDLLEERLAVWVSQHGGWMGLTKQCHRLRRTRSRLTLPLPLSTLPLNATLFLRPLLIIIAFILLVLLFYY